MAKKKEIFTECPKCGSKEGVGFQSVQVWASHVAFGTGEVSTDFEYELKPPKTGKCVSCDHRITLSKVSKHFAKPEADHG